MGITTIHVVDDGATPPTTTFQVETGLLLRHMPLLAAEVHDVPGQAAEVRLDCDSPTFAWLLAYVKSQQHHATPQQQQHAPPALEHGNCIALLLASHYLRMRPVVKGCVAFIAANLLPLASAAAHQLLALEPSLFSRVANAAAEEVLQALVEQAAQLQQQHDCKAAAQHSTLAEKLFKAKLGGLLAQHHTTLLSCSECGQLFSAAAHQKLRCPAVAAAGGVVVLGRAQGLMLHHADSSWDMQAYLKQQRQPGQLNSHRTPAPTGSEQQQQQQQSWRQLYWRVWGHVVVLYCQRCWAHFPARQHAWCSYHPMPPVFVSDAAAGRHPCCGAPAWRPGAPSTLHQCCCSRPHDCGSSNNSVETARALQLLARYATLISEQQQQQQPHSSSSSTVRGESPMASSAVPLLVRLAQRSRRAQSPPPAAASSGRRCSSPPRRVQEQSPLSPAATAQAAVSHSTRSNGSDSDTGSSSSDGKGSSVSRASDAAGSDACSPQQPAGEPDDAADEGSPSCSSQLGSFLAAARSACNRGGGFAAAAAGSRGSSAAAAAAAAARMQQAEFAAPLAETFSAGGKHGLVLQAARHASATAGSRLGTAAAAAASEAPMTRTWLLEMVRQDDETRMNLLMRHLDAMRRQPPPDAPGTVEANGQAARKQKKRGAGAKPGRKAPHKS